MISERVYRHLLKTLEERFHRHLLSAAEELKLIRQLYIATDSETHNEAANIEKLETIMQKLDNVIHMMH